LIGYYLLPLREKALSRFWSLPGVSDQRRDGAEKKQTNIESFIMREISLLLVTSFEVTVPKQASPLWLQGHAKRGGAEKRRGRKDESNKPGL
jgi:hypothetical protein